MRDEEVPPALWEVDWRRSDGDLLLRVSIPPNTTAEVHVPKLGANGVTIHEDGRALWALGKLVAGVPGIQSASESAQAVALTVASGTYVFRSSPILGTG